MVVVERPAPVTRAQSHLTGRRVQRMLSAGAIHGLLIAGLMLVFFPITWAVSTSLKEPGEIFLYPPTWIPNPVRWQNYVQAMTTADFGRYFLNTTFITLVDIVAKVMSCSIVAFSFARMRWWGRDVLFMVMLSTLMLPQQVTLIP